MRAVEPQVFLVAETRLIEPGIVAYLDTVDAADWTTDAAKDAEQLVEIAGRICYRSWKPGLNANVTRVREGNRAYLDNVIAQGHGSVFEHASVSFIFHHVSRVFTHELVRHRAGVAISQESMRYVRLTDVPMVLPDATLAELTGRVEAHERAHPPEDGTLIPVQAHVDRIVGDVEAFQSRCGAALDGLPMHDKKRLTSFMRRLAPDGVATSILWTANMRTLRHVIEQRTAASAEEEIRLVFDLVAAIVTERYPAIFQDFKRSEAGEWVPTWSKI